MSDAVGIDPSPGPLAAALAEGRGWWNRSAVLPAVAGVYLIPLSDPEAAAAVA